MMRTRRRLVPLLALLPAVLLASCGSPAAANRTHKTGGVTRDGSFPASIEAANGEVTIRSRPTAVVSLSPTATEMLYAIGAGPQVKAVDEDSNYPARAPRTKLDGLEPNVEAIASYKPDLVIVSDDSSSLNHQLALLHIPVLDEPAAADLADEYSEFIQIGEATGHPAAARAEVTKLKREIASIVTRAHVKTRATYYYEVGIAPYYSVTSSTFVGHLLALLGLRSIADAVKGAAASGGYPELNPEFIVKADPDYIFLADTVCCHQSAATVAARPGWSVLSAVEHDRILGLNDNIASRWGPRVVILLRDVAREIERHPVAS